MKLHAAIIYPAFSGALSGFGLGQSIGTGHTWLALCLVSITAAILFVGYVLKENQDA